MEGSKLPKKQFKTISLTQSTSISRLRGPPRAQNNEWKQSHTKHTSEKFQNTGDREKVLQLPARKNRSHTKGLVLGFSIAMLKAKW